MLTSVSSFLLIGSHGERRGSRVGAVTALAVTGGGLALRAGLLLLSRVVGSFQLSAIFTARETIAAQGLHLPIVVLVLLIPSWQDLRDLRASERSRTFEETARRQHDR